MPSTALRAVNCKLGLNYWNLANASLINCNNSDNSDNKPNGNYRPPINCNPYLEVWKHFRQEANVNWISLKQGDRDVLVLCDS